MPYATPADMKSRFPEKDLKELTDVNGQTIDDARLARALADASDEIDGYLMGRYKLPLEQIPRSLGLYACDIAMYRIQALRPKNDIEDAKDRYDSAIRYLKDVSKGAVNLALNDAGQPAEQTDGPIVVTADRNFTRTSMRGL
jgi:phage gp36-like protein